MLYTIITGAVLGAFLVYKMFTWLECDELFEELMDTKND